MLRDGGRVTLLYYYKPNGYYYQHDLPLPPLSRKKKKKLAETLRVSNREKIRRRILEIESEEEILLALLAEED